MKQGVKPWLTVAVSVLAGACSGGDIGAEYANVSEEESRLLFYGPGLAGGYRQILTGTDGKFVRRTVAMYGPTTGTYPHARIYYAEMPPGRQFKRDVTAEDTIRHWGWARNKTVEPGITGTTVNSMGRIGYAVATADGITCLVWRQPMGARDNGGVGTRLLSGYYCRGEGQTFSAAEAESIVKLIGHRDYGPVDPPAGWLDAGTLRIAVMWKNASSGLDHFRGVVRVPREGGSGLIEVGPRGGRKCSGPLIPVGAEGGRAVMKWTLTCSDGLTAKGSLRYRKSDDYVVGEGQDSAGRGLALID
jgi:hypothetical protein